MSVDAQQLKDAFAAVKPKLRGWLHAGTFPVAVVAGLTLIALAPSQVVRITAAVYTLTAALLFGVSAVYHRGRWSPPVQAVLKRLDHANIFLIIAGTYTPFTLLVLPSEQARVLLTLVWAGAVLGVGFRVFWVNAPRWLYVPIYVALGWSAVFWLPQFASYGGTTIVALIITGGLMYTLGALVYGMKRPNPSPRWFGFHEVFHAFTLAGFASHHVGIWLAAFGAGAVAAA
ncbi:PAQR family membrane homeostasis protein TrhA [Phytoactinopolyspora halotolerans]|uniref:Hemolysin III family protein n=1 Tax=Phytoactinopolyspora halotolerans TaxID=1981512 RepID=A0A6L9S484_9ACTN|nr:hemolysin III family protein [Phytoactinopolyspora halotolerans]NED99812.1 hemolysin III family protein [Phytoactinopolyspora halotolerans]